VLREIEIFGKRTCREFLCCISRSKCELDEYFVFGSDIGYQDCPCSWSERYLDSVHLCGMPGNGGQFFCQEASLSNCRSRSNRRGGVEERSLGAQCFQQYILYISVRQQLLWIFCLLCAVDLQENCGETCVKCWNIIHYGVIEKGAGDCSRFETPGDFGGDPSSEGRL
jgi:hypothetical protein